MHNGSGANQHTQALNNLRTCFGSFGMIDAVLAATCATERNPSTEREVLVLKRPDGKIIVFAKWTKVSS